MDSSPKVVDTQTTLPLLGSCFALFLVLLTLLCIKYPNRYIGTRDRPDLPGPKGIPVVGNLFQIIPHVKRMVYWMDDMANEYGPLYSFTMPGWGRNIVINHPDWIEHMKKKDTTTYTKGSQSLAIFNEFPGRMSPFAADGASWRACRKLISPIFAIRKFDLQVSRAMHEIVPIAKEMLLAAADSELVFDWNNFSGRLAISMLYRMVFGIDPGTLTKDISCLNEPDVLVNALNTCNTTSSGRLYNPIWKLTDKITGVGRRFETARSELFRIAGALIQQRRAQDAGVSVNDGDFLTALLESGLNDWEILDTIVTLFFAGHDNFLNVLGWSLHELSKAPQWMSRMKQEAMERNSAGGVIDYGDVSKFPVHLAVFYETLRLWPGVPKNARFASENDILPAIPSLGLGPIAVHKGDYLLWSDRSMMRSKLVWGERADAFDPGRHLDSDGQFIKPPPPKFHAFGGGPRYCPGAQLGTYEFVVMWTAVLPDIEVIPVHVKDRIMEDSFTSTMKGTFDVTIRKV